MCLDASEVEFVSLVHSAAVFNLSWSFTCQVQTLHADLQLRSPLAGQHHIPKLWSSHPKFLILSVQQYIHELKF